MRGSREISLVPSLHRASTDALIRIMKLVASGMKLRAEVSILHFYKLKCTIT